jgi:hypothetical protein
MHADRQTNLAKLMSEISPNSFANSAKYVRTVGSIDRSHVSFSEACCHIAVFDTALVTCQGVINICLYGLVNRVFIRLLQTVLFETLCSEIPFIFIDVSVPPVIGKCLQ